MLDPASATIAFIGFGASLATLAGLLIQSIDTITDLCKKFNSAPNEMRRFSSTLKQLELLLALLKNRTDRYTDEDIPEELDALWRSSVSEMTDDYNELGDLFRRLQTRFSDKSLTKKHIRAHIRNMFSAQELLDFEKKLSSHICKFNLALSMLNDAETKRNGALLSTISDDATKARHQYHDGFSSLGSTAARQEECLYHIAEEMSGVRQDVGMILRSSYCDPNNQTGYIRPSRSFTTDGRQNPRVHKILLNLVQETGSYSLTFNYWFGVLNVRIKRRPIWCAPFGKTGKENDINQNADFIGLTLTFVPPYWISDAIITIAMESDMGLQLKRGRVNQDEYLERCLLLYDIPGLQSLFFRGAAHPTDLILCQMGGDTVPMSLLEWCCLNPNYDYLYQEQVALYKFLLRQTERIMISLEDFPQVLNNSISMLHQSGSEVCDIMINQGIDLAGALNKPTGYSIIESMYSTCPRAYVQDFCNRYIDSEVYWNMDSVCSWLLRTIARADPRFAAKLKSGERTMRNSNCKRESCNGLVMDFSLETQLQEMKLSSFDHQLRYLNAICANGTPSELDPVLMHLENSICKKDSMQLNGNLLEFAAAYQNLEVFEWLYARIGGQGKVVESVPAILSYLTSIRRICFLYNKFWKDLNDRDRMLHLLIPDIDRGLLGRVLQNGFELKRRGKVYPRAYLGLPLPPKRIQEFAPQLQHGILMRAAADEKIQAGYIQLVKSAVLGDYQDKHGFTPVMKAIASGSVNATRALIDAGSDIMHQKDCGFSVYQLVKLLLELPFSDNQPCWVRFLMYEASGNKLAFLMRKRDFQEYHSSHYRCRECFQTRILEVLEVIKDMPQFKYLIASDDIYHNSTASTTRWMKWKSTTSRRFTALIFTRLQIFLRFRLNAVYFMPKSKRPYIPPLMAMLGYSIAILVHIGYDIADFILWIFDLPKMAFKILVLVLLLWVFRCWWLWWL